VTHLLDLRSDTVTRPSPGMRDAMHRAVVGDDVLGDDPTTNAFQERIADLLGMEEALFFPSGTQANQTALAILTEPASEVVVEANCHISDYEDVAAAALSGLQLRRVATPDGILTPELVEGAIRADDPFLPRTSLVAVEDTHLDSGGRVMTPAQLGAIASVTRARGVALHIDGARLWNASVAVGAPAAEFTRHADTVMVCMSKGLGAPIGSVLAGTQEHIRAARRVRRRFGGAMRQTGILTAAAEYALDHNLERLSDDHERARKLAEGINSISGLTPVAPETSIVFIEVDRDVGTAEHVILEARARGVLFSRFGPQRLRAVTHLEVDDAGIEGAITALRDAVAALD
jgi:threonine aldolase